MIENLNKINFPLETKYGVLNLHLSAPKSYSSLNFNYSNCKGGRTSDELGNCECCDKPGFINSLSIRELHVNQDSSHCYAERLMTWGHKECLETQIKLIERNKKVALYKLNN